MNLSTKLDIEKVVSEESKQLMNGNQDIYIFKSITLFDLSMGVEIKNNE